MDLTQLITEEVVKIPLLGRTKSAVLREFVEFLAERGRIGDARKVYDALLDREGLGSTGLEMGIAIPHCRSDAVGSLIVAAGVSPGGVNFESLDGATTRLFFVVLAPFDQPASHVQLLSEIGALTRSAAFVRALMEAATAEEFVRRFRQ